MRRKKILIAAASLGLAGLLIASVFTGQLEVIIALALAPWLLLLADGPLLVLAGILLTARTVFDGAWNLPIGPSNASGVIGVAIIAIGVSLALRGSAGSGLVLSVFAWLAVSNVFAAQTWGQEVQAELVRFASVLAVILIALRIRKPLTLTQLAGFVHFVAVVPALLVIFQFATGTGMLVEGLMRPAGSMAHPNSAAVLLSIAAAVSLSAAITSRRRRRLNVMMTGIYSSAVVMTASVGGLTTLVVMLVGVVLLSPGVGVRVRVAAVLAPLAVGTAFVFSTVGAERLAEFSSINISADTASTNSLEWRFSNWRRVLLYWDESPIFGQGYGATSTGELMQGYIPHNEYVRLLVELGLFGAVIVGGAAMWILISMMRARRSPDAGVAAAGALAVAILIGLCVSSFGANTFLYTPSTYLAAFVLTMIWRSAHSPNTVISDGGSRPRLTTAVVGGRR